MSRLLIAALAAAAAVTLAPTAAANPSHDVLCYTNPAFANGHSSICSDARNPLGDEPNVDVL
ncbi:hypothetical protein [Mycolicibacterium goodii]